MPGMPRAASSESFAFGLSVMQFLAKLLRRNGVLLAKEEVARRPWTLVQLMTEPDAKTGRRRLTLRGGEEGQFAPPRFELFQVTLASVTHDEFVLRGIEAAEVGGRNAAVVQEMVCKPKPELGGAGWASPRAKEFSRDFQALLT